MKVLNKRLIALSLGMTMLILTGCSKKNISLAENKKTKQQIQKQTYTNFWGVVKLGAEAAAAEFGVDINFNAPQDEEDIDDQISMVQQAIDRKSDAIVLAASDYKKLVEVAEKAVEKGIPVIIIDSAIDSDKITTFIATNNKAAGKMEGYKLADLLNGKGNVGIVSFVKGTAPAEQREEGLRETIGKYPDIKLVQRVYCNSSVETAEELTKKMISENGNIDAIVGLNATSTIGAANAIKELKLYEKVKVVGFDCYPEHIDHLEEGIIDATVVQNPYSMGYLGIKYSLDVLNGKEVPSYVNTGSKVIDKKNMYLPENQKLLFPFVD